MNTLASILSGIPGNPYQGAGGGIAPLLQQALLAQQLGGPQLGQGGAGPDNPQLPGTTPPGMGINPMMNPRMAADQGGIGSLAQLALPGIATGAY